MGYMHANVWFINSKVLVQLSIQKRSHLRVLSSNHSHAILALFLLLLIQTSSPASAQFAAPVPQDLNKNNKSDFAIMGIVVIMFFISGFLSIYSRQCAGGRVPIINLSLPNVDNDRQTHSESNNGLNQEIIDTFPTFLYSNVKGLKIGKGTLACAVCLNEFEDEETLRLIPDCNHVFHPSCIDVWLASHSTCPLCRANLVPRLDTVPIVSIQIPNDDDHHPNEEETVTTRDDMKRDNDVESESPKVDYLLHRSHTMNHSRPTRSRSTGFLFNVLFPRCNSTGHRQGENLGRFTLRLPDEVRSHVLNSALKRANSSVCFTRMSSGRKGYRTRSVGSARGSEEEWGFTLTPPFFTRNSWNGSVRKSHVPRSGVALLDNNIVGERSSDLLCPGLDQT